MLFFTLKVIVAVDLYFMNHQELWFLAKTFFIFYYSTEEKKVTHVLNGLRVSKLTANFHFWWTIHSMNAHC